ncbi:MAG: hypothetical protein KatS3mg110_0854 [Pirellulaceae bacterium]|nr:MAG: hypothetical protein KatS3mg110_0854 [Pirellulaceae bacterium]
MCRAANFYLEDTFLKEYLAVSYLRDAILTGDMHREKKQWIDGQGLCADVFGFSEKLVETWNRILEVFEVVRLAEEVASALSLGSKVYKMRFGSVIELLTARAPVVDPENTEAYLAEAEKALLVLEVAPAWYHYVE